MTIEVHVVRVFTDDQGSHGNPLGIVHASAVAESDRQAVATELGFSETIFYSVDDAVGASARIYTPAVELPFAGHPTVGLSWWLRDRGTPVESMSVPAGEVRVRYDGATTWVRARADWAPLFDIHPLASVADVDAAEPTAVPSGHHYLWAWVDEDAGRIRSRMFATEMGIAEDEATGSAAVRITEALGRGLHIRQGAGSTLLTALHEDGWIEVGGTTVFDHVITLGSSPQ